MLFSKIFGFVGRGGNSGLQVGRTIKEEYSREGVGVEKRTGKISGMSLLMLL